MVRLSERTTVDVTPYTFLVLDRLKLVKSRFKTRERGREERGERRDERRETREER